MATSEHEIESFSEFAKSQLKDSRSDASIDELFEEWRTLNPPSEDALAIQASIRDMENGETGRPFEEFAAEFRKRNNLTDGE
jgi:hypothetical protein